MIDGQRVLGLVPARGGSKGLPGKNIMTVAGKPLIAWTIEGAKASRHLDLVVTSTDDPAIRACALKHGSSAPFLRPAELATDLSNVVDTALHALDTLTEQYELLVLLQPTSPMRLAEDIDHCIERLSASDADACASIVQPDKSPYWCLSDDGGGYLQPLFPDHARMQRQQLPEAFIPNGAVFVVKTAVLREQRRFVTNRTLGYQMPRERSLDIDDPIDLHLADTLLSQTAHDEPGRLAGTRR